MYLLPINRMYTEFLFVSFLFLYLTDIKFRMVCEVERNIEDEHFDVNTYL